MCCVEVFICTMERYISYRSGLKNIISSADPIQTNSQWCFHLVIQSAWRVQHCEISLKSLWQQWRWDHLKACVTGCVKNTGEWITFCALMHFLKKGEKWIKYHVSGLPKSVAAGLCQVYVLTPTEARNPHPQPPPHVHTPHCFYMWETLLTGSDETKYIIGNSQPRSLWVYGGLINTSSIHPFPPPTPTPHPHLYKALP